LKCGIVGTRANTTWTTNHFVEKIDWLKKKLKEENISHPNGNMGTEELTELQKASLIATSDQMETLYENKKVQQPKTTDKKKS
jgi:hypothetical protein